MSMRKLSFLLTFLLFVGFSASAQMQITGQVTNAQSGDPIPGVSIVVKGQTTIGTTTDMDGNYSLEVPSDAQTLVYSFVGMQTREVSIRGRSTIDVAMEPAVEEMEEVVVTALGISREKKQLGYSVQDVSGESLNQASQADAISSLQGRVAGVQIRSSGNMGGSNKILIRGATSIQGDSNPLIIVDGVPLDNSNFNSTNAQAGYGGYDYGNMLNDIPPEEIKSMSVLKGAAAALYGSRAANGVILIETKSGQAGKEGFSVNVTSSVDFDEVYELPALQDRYGGGAIMGTANGFQQVTIDETQYSVPQYAVDESWGPAYNQDIEVLHWDAFSPNSYPDQYLNPRPWVASPNDVETFYDLGVAYKNNIGVSKTGENYGMRLSYSNTSIDGRMPGSEQAKNNVKLNGNANLGERVNVEATINYMNHYTKGRPQIGYGDESVGQKFFQWGQRQLDYDRMEEYKEDDGDQRTWNRIAWDDPTPKYADNPFWSSYENFPEDSRSRVFGNLGVSVNITDNLKAEGNIYGDYYNFRVEQRRTIGSQAQPYYQETIRENTEFNYEGRLNYTQDFGDIRLSGVAGGNIRETKYQLNSGTTSGGLVVPGIFSLENSISDASTTDFMREKRVNSLFAQANIGYGGFVNVDLSVRNDWSSTLPEDNNSYFYYGASGSFIFSEFIDASWMNLAKIRGGYTQVGNDTNPYQVKSTFNYNADGSFAGSPRLFISNDLVNPNLKPELTTTTEVGFDLTVLENRFNLSATYFNKSTTDQIIELEVAKGSGYASKIINAGELVSEGLELQMGVVPVRNNNFNWRIDFNYTQTKMTVPDIHPKVQALDIVRAPFGGVFLRASEGDEYGQLWGIDYIYDDNGNRVLNGPTYMAEPNLKPMGSVYPDYNLGITNSFSYKDFSLSFLIDIQKGGKFYSLSHMWGMYSGMLEATAQINDKGNNIREPVSEGGGIKLDGVNGDVTFNDDGTYTVSNVTENEAYTSGELWSRYHYHGLGTPSAQSVFDADYVKLREVTLGYNFGSLFNDFVKRARVSVYGRNLATWGLDLDGFDPEMTVVGSGNIQGIDGGLQPMARTMGIKLDLTF